MAVISAASVCKKVSILLIFGLGSILHLNLYDNARSSLFAHGREIEATKEWQRVEGNDTIPAGAHVRMDMTTGEKWVKLMSDDEGSTEEDRNKIQDVNIERNNDGVGKSSVSLAVVDSDGEVTIENDVENPKTTNYNFEMMYRTLSKLPPEEIVAMGGLPEMPDTKEGPVRSAFEERMLEIWTKRQEELLEMELNFPEILKARIAGIKEYLLNPTKQLELIDLNAEEDEGSVTDIVSLLKDLEFQLSDIDMARDFHTMEGWPLLVKLVAEETHIPANTTIDDFSAGIKTAIRAVQAHAAWAIGTAVKNTEEFFPYSIEAIHLGDRKTTTTIDLLIDVFCTEYDDPRSWEIRTLLAKCIYGIGAVLRGNPLVQKHVAKTDGFDRLGQKLQDLSRQGFNSANTKLIQRLAGLATDIVHDLALHIEMSEETSDADVIRSLSSSFCDAACSLFSAETFIPMMVQETLVNGISVLAPHCDNPSCGFQSIVEKIQSEWVENKDSFDHDHFQELRDLAIRALEALEK